jgi:hypothetical protein
MGIQLDKMTATGLSLSVKVTVSDLLLASWLSLLV